MRLKIVTVMATAFDDEEPLTPEEVLLRFKKIMGREMTPEEKHSFFVSTEPPEVEAERLKFHQRTRDKKF
jgi:hypothetical protein